MLASNEIWTKAKRGKIITLKLAQGLTLSGHITNDACAAEMGDVDVTMTKSNLSDITTSLTEIN